MGIVLQYIAAIFVDELIQGFRVTVREAIVIHTEENKGLPLDTFKRGTHTCHVDLQHQIHMVKFVFESLNLSDWVVHTAAVFGGISNVRG